MKHPFFLIALLLVRLCGNHAQVPQPIPLEPLPEEQMPVVQQQPRKAVEEDLGVAETEEDLYYKEAVYGERAWNDTVQVFHRWLELNELDYLFDAPTSKQVEAWKKLCIKNNTQEKPGLPAQYLNMNQYVTLWDFIELWYRDNAPVIDDDFILWRLAQYEEQYHLQDSEYNRFYYLRNTIQGLCLFDDASQFESNIKAGLECDFQEFYDRIMLREAVRHSSPRVAAALREEQKAWQNYHKNLSAAFQVIDGDVSGLNGSAWPMAICGIEEDNARMRETSLADYYFALTDSLDYDVRHSKSAISSYEIVRHKTVTQERVLKEYGSFMNSFEEREYKYPVADRRKALAKETEAWKRWMQKRDAVSSLLTGLCKETYDNATNNVRRQKLIMLKNRYNGYGITSGEVLDCLIPYSATDEELAGPSFNEKWKELY